jgi:predicted RND superfamily exporter protein
MAAQEKAQITRFEEAVGRYAEGVLKLRWFIIATSVALLATALWSIKSFIGFDTDYRVFFGKDNPQLLAFDNLENTYTKVDNVFYVLDPDGDVDIFTRETLAAIEFLTEESWLLPFSTRVDSITNFTHTIADGDDLLVAEMAEDWDNITDAELALIKDVVLNEPLLLDRVVSSDKLAGAGKIAAVSVTFTFPKEDILEVPQTVTAARDLEARLLEKFPHLTTYMSGSTMLNNAFSEAAQSDLSGLIPMMYLVVIVTMYLLLRSWAGVVTTLSVVTISAMGALGIIAALGVKLTPPTASTPTVIMTLAVADSIHILVSMIVGMREGKNKHEALVYSLQLNMLPVFLTSITTALGFLSMNFADAPPLREFGNISAIGVMIAFFASVTLLPAMMSLLPIKARTEKDWVSNMMGKMGGWVAAKYKPVLLVSAAMCGALIWCMQYNVADDRFAEYFDERVRFRADTDFMFENITGIYAAGWDLDTGESWGVADPEYLKILEAFEAFWLARPETVHVDSIIPMMKRVNKSMNGDDPAAYAIPESRELAVDNLFLYEMGLPFGLDLTNQINLDKSGSRFTVTWNNVGSAQTRELEAMGRAWLQENAPQLYGEGTGPAVMFSHISKRNIDSMYSGTTFALVGISFILIFALRSLGMGFLSLVPNLVPLGIGFGVWALWNGQIIFTMAAVSGMTLGIIVDDTIHFLSKYLRARRVLGYSAEEAVRYTFETVGAAIVVTTLILVAGFTIMGTSPFAPNASMAQVTAFAIGGAMLADFFLLPTLLIWFAKRRMARGKDLANEAA